MEKHSRITTRTGHNNQEQDPIKIPWRKVWSSLKFIPDRKMADVHFRLLHRALPVGENIQKWKPAMDHPCGCHYPLETHQHLFATCPYSVPTWNLVDSVMSRLMKDRFVSSAQTRITGTFPCPRRLRKNLLVWKILFSCAIHSIWTSRCSRVMEQKEISQHQVKGTTTKKIRIVVTFMVIGAKGQRQADLLRILTKNEAVLLCGSKPGSLLFLTIVSEKDGHLKRETGIPPLGNLFPKTVVLVEDTFPFLTNSPPILNFSGRK